MPTFNRDALRKGSKAIDETLAARRSGGGDFKPFLTNIYWKNDKDYRYLMFLNPLEEVNEFEFHPYIDCDDGKPHMCISHSDRTFGGLKDEIQEKWGYKPKTTDLAIAVELEPITEIVNKRAKPVGFEVKTTTFDRKIRDDEGNATDEVEEVTVPVVGLVAQSPFNFFNLLKEYDTSEAAIHTTPIKITRVGEKTNVTYQITGYDMIKPDLSGLLDYVENLSYVSDPEQLLETIEAAGEDTDAATIAIGEYLLNKRVDELADVDLYNEILSNISKPARFQDKQEGKTAAKRPSQRRMRTDGSSEEPPVARSREPEEAETQVSAKDARMAKLRARSKPTKQES